MGWFWAESSPSSSSRPQPPHPLPRGDAEPPPGCPMHKSSNASSSSPPLASTPPPTTDSSQQTPSYISKLNPLNYMPTTISNTRDSTTQSISLPLEREASTIPRGDGTGTTWEYPSPQQMYNAMLRKGYTDTPAEHVESMVAVHNFLNEGAWEEIREWERRFGGGLGRGWEYSKHGEEGAKKMAALRSNQQETAREPTLLRFMGRPDDPTPKARLLSLMSHLYPSAFPDNPPFDRHDWFVQRNDDREVRYVIDYYSGPPEPTGEPVFYLDVRPAVDGPTAACERLMRWGGDLWFRASGGVVREEGLSRKGR